MGEDQLTQKDLERARWEGATTQQLTDICTSVRNLDKTMVNKADKADVAKLQETIDAKADQTDYEKLDKRISSLERKVYIGVGILITLQVIIGIVK